MSGLTARPYTPSDAEAWNRFVAGSRNGTFLHDRGFMDYHADRFQDASYIVEQDGTPVALLPANRKGPELISHGGLTYGGVLSGPSMTAARMVEAVDCLQDRWRQDGFKSVYIKPVPHVFHRQPAEEDVFALCRLGARVVRTDLSSAIPMARRLPLAKGRKSGASKARRNGLQINEAGDMAAFWAVLEATLGARHGAAPVHSLAEITLLHSRFPEQIRLFTAEREGVVMAGVLVFDCGITAHAQYMAASAEGRDTGALDLVVKHLLNEVFAARAWFDFGISTTDGGQTLNVGLSRQKEMFGARSVVFQHYQLDLT